MAFGQSSQALLTTLYRSTDRLRRGGAAVKNLAQSASLHAGENNAPSKPGTKQCREIGLLRLARQTACRPGGPIPARCTGYEIGRASGRHALQVILFVIGTADLDGVAGGYGRRIGLKSATLVFRRTQPVKLK